MFISHRIYAIVFTSRWRIFEMRCVSDWTQKFALACEQFLGLWREKKTCWRFDINREQLSLKVTVDGTDKNILTFESFNWQSITWVAPMMSSLEEANKGRTYREPFCLHWGRRQKQNIHIVKKGDHFEHRTFIWILKAEKWVKWHKIIFSIKL